MKEIAAIATLLVAFGLMARVVIMSSGGHRNRNTPPPRLLPRGRCWQLAVQRIPRALSLTSNKQSMMLQIDNATGAGQSCGQICTLYRSTSQTPVKTLIHPSGHLYPPWMPGETVKFCKTRLSRRMAAK